MTEVLGRSAHQWWVREDDPLALLALLDEIDSDLRERILARFTATSYNTREEAERKLANCLSYLLARSAMSDPAANLVANLGPDEAWHVFIHFTKEYSQFCLRHAGEYLHHDPAGEAALVNIRSETERTVALFERHGIPYDAELWRDHETYPHGASVVKTAVVARTP